MAVRGFCLLETHVLDNNCRFLGSHLAIELESAIGPEFLLMVLLEVNERLSKFLLSFLVLQERLCRRLSVGKTEFLHEVGK
jgi:hypothetical protein